jgi:hypothetical protein
VSQTASAYTVLGQAGPGPTSNIHRVGSSCAYTASVVAINCCSAILSSLTLLLSIRLDELDLCVAVQVAVCSSLVTFVCCFPIGSLVTAAVCGVVSWSRKFPLQLAFIRNLSHACSPAIRSSPTRSSSAVSYGRHGGDVFDFSDITSSCQALAVRQRARYLKYVRPPEVQMLAPIHRWALKRAKVLRLCKSLSTLLGQTLIALGVLYLLGPSEAESQIRAITPHLFDRVASCILCLRSSPTGVIWTLPT